MLLHRWLNASFPSSVYRGRNYSQIVVFMFILVAIFHFCMFSPLSHLSLAAMASLGCLWLPKVPILFQNFSAPISTPPSAHIEISQVLKLPIPLQCCYKLLFCFSFIMAGKLGKSYMIKLIHSKVTEEAPSLRLLWLYFPFKGER